NLSARQGRRLRQLIGTSPEAVVLHAWVDAELVEGSSDLVCALLPGTDLADEEIWVLAHLSEPGARDNASGCCLSLELARVLGELTTSGRLPPLRRSIRFLHAVEVDGFLPYLHENQRRFPKILAGLCLDSVGQDFSRCGGQMVLFRSPEQAPSFVDALMETLFGVVAAIPASRFGADSYAAFPWHTAPFWGNDAFISDGFFDIPTPQVSGWPDRYYHSSHDTPDQMSRATLGRVGAAAGAYLYLLATAGAREARWFGILAAQDWKRRIAAAVTDGADAAMAPHAPGADRLFALLHHLGLQGCDAILQAGRFAPQDASLRKDLHALAKSVANFAAQEGRETAALVTGALPQEPAAPPHVEGEEMTARRLRWKAPAASVLSPGARDQVNALWGPEHGITNLARLWGWIDGRRNAREIYQRLLHGGEIPLPEVVACLRLLAAEGVVALNPSGE
ncbi:MAG: hypothetical protein QHJ73_17105, partial [Armatimonadota bacterium]|nr:hypothetical protein [Armatimonadota bacterium]